IMVDIEGVIYDGREKDMNPWKAAHAVKTDIRTLEDALKGADVFLGLSVANIVTPEMVKSMADQPIIFAMANPIPEIMPDVAKDARPDAIVATGRSDFPNQVNNVLGFPYIFRGALDVRASSITQGMKIAAAKAIAKLAREDVPDEVNEAYEGKVLHYGNDYIIPAPFDRRLIVEVSSAVAKAAMDDGVARKPIDDMTAYRHGLSARLDPTASTLQKIFDRIKGKNLRVVFAEGEEERVVRAALAFRNAGYGEPIMVAREHRLAEAIERIGLEGAEDLICINAKNSGRNEDYIDQLYAKLQRNGAMRRDCQRMVNQDRNIFAAAMVDARDADAMVTGTTRSFKSSFDHITRVIKAQNRDIFAMSMMVSRGTTVSNFGNPWMHTADYALNAVEVLDQRQVDFEYDGELTADVALDYDLMKANYPFSRLSGPANVLIMPGLHSANIAFKLLKKLGGGSTIGPIIFGADKPFQIVPMGASVNDIVQAAALSAFESLNK
ncbi:MAG: phosphate acyltransferase, partial [Alphaproteobacteria bacterium]